MHPSLRIDETGTALECRRWLQGIGFNISSRIVSIYSGYQWAIRVRLQRAESWWLTNRYWMLSSMVPSLRPSSESSKP